MDQQISARRGTRVRTVGAVLLVAGLVLSACGGDTSDPAAAPGDGGGDGDGTEAPYFEGKEITLTTSFSPGGGGDFVTRLHGDLFEQFIPGNPTVMVENREGGAHSIGNNWFYDNAATDCTDLLFTANTAIDQFSRGGDHIQFDLLEYDWVGSLKYGGNITIAHADAVERIEDPSAEPAVVGDTDGTRSASVVTMFAARHLDHNFRWAIGYEGGDELDLAFLQHETDVTGSATGPEIADIMEETGAVPLYQNGREGRVPEFPDVPTIWELLEETDTFTEDEAAALELALSQERVNDLVAAPPDTDAECLEIVRDAYREIAEAPELREALVPEYGDIVINFRDGPETLELVTAMHETPQEVKDLLADIRREAGLPAGD